VFATDFTRASASSGAKWRAVVHTRGCNRVRTGGAGHRPDWGGIGGESLESAFSKRGHSRGARSRSHSRGCQWSTGSVSLHSAMPIQCRRGLTRCYRVKVAGRRAAARSKVPKHRTRCAAVIGEPSMLRRVPLCALVLVRKSIDYAAHQVDESVQLAQMSWVACSAVEDIVGDDRFGSDGALRTPARQTHGGRRCPVVLLPTRCRDGGALVDGWSASGRHSLSVP
jgi:hypothetical protein